MLKSLHRFEMACGTLLLSGICILVGCQPKSDVAEGDAPEASPTSAVASPANASNDGDGQSDASPIVEQGALNAKGQIVLQGEVAPQDPAPPQNTELTQNSESPPSTDSAQNAAPPNTELAKDSEAPPLASPEDSQTTTSSDISLSLDLPLSQDDASDSRSTDSAEDAPADAPPATSPAPELESALPAQANVVSDAERKQAIAQDWPEPQAVIFVSGQQHGYIEPCGCTGLENQKGGLIRRDTLLTSLRDRGWNLVPVDVGNQVRRSGPQPTLKFQSTVDAFKLMDYAAVTLGIDDLQLSGEALISLAGSDDRNPMPFISANAIVFDASFFPSYRIVEVGGRKIGITGVVGAEYKDKIQSSEIELLDPVESLEPVVAELKQQGCDFLVLLAHATTTESASIASRVDAFDLVVTAGGFGEPTLNPEPIDGTNAVMVQVGTKGMYGGIVGLFDDPQQPIRYQKIAISSQFKDSPRMLTEFASYQQRLKSTGLAGLGVTPLAHPTGREFVGSEVCGDCHTTAYDIWQNSPHVHATESIVSPNNDRGGIPRHHDPECISCHVTGWEPQLFYPFKSGFESLEASEHLHGSGCENCHGPGSRHVAAELGDIDATTEELVAFQQEMVLKLADAQQTCLKCHDLDNSPDFHKLGAFQEYWEQVKHAGKD